MATVGNQYARGKLIKFGLLLGGALLLIAVIPLPFLFRCDKQQWIFFSYNLILVIIDTWLAIIRLSQIREIRQRLNLEFFPFRHILECNFTVPFSQDLASVAQAYTCMFFPSLVLLHYLAINGIALGIGSAVISLGLLFLYGLTIEGDFKKEPNHPDTTGQSNLTTEQLIVFLPILLIIGIDLLTGLHLINFIAAQQCSNPNPIILDALPDIWNNTLLIVSYIAAYLLYYTFDVYKGLKDLLKHDKDALLRALGAVSYEDMRNDDPEDPDYQFPNRFD